MFPVIEKTPATTHGFHDATRDFDMIEAWWPDDTDRGIALATGGPSGVWVLDLDGTTAVDALLDLQAEYGKLTTTVTSRTARGFHLFFAMPAGRDVRNSAGGVAEEIDVRGTGGYVVLPPSPHPNGVSYQWARGRGPEDAAVADTPGWLLTWLSPAPTAGPAWTMPAASHQPKPYIVAAIESECLVLASTAPGRRNEVLNTAAFKLARLVATGNADATPVVRALALAAAAAGLGAHEIERTLLSAFAARGLK